MQLVIVLLPLLISTLVQDVKCGSRKPLLRKPSGSAKTGCFIIAINEKATEAEVDELMKRVILASDEHKMFGRVQKATRAFTVKLSAYSLEMVYKARSYSALTSSRVTLYCNSPRAWG